MSQKLDRRRKALLRQIDTRTTFIEKLEMLNNRFLTAKTKQEEDMILGLIEQLKLYGN